MYKREISKNLKKLRSEKKLTQRELSEDMNCSEVHISNLERDMANPSTQTVINMANSLRVPLSAILNDGSDEKYDRKEYGSEIGTLRTMYILRMVYEIKKQLIEYERESGISTEDIVAEDINYKALGENIGRLRREKNISRAIMAKRIGMNEGTYRNIESNNSKASLEKYMEIAKELNVSIDYIFEDSLVNKEQVSREYIHKIFDDVDGRKKQILKEIAQTIYGVFKGHGI